MYSWSLDDPPLEHLRPSEEASSPEDGLTGLDDYNSEFMFESGFNSILVTKRFDGLPGAWKTTQLALAEALHVGIRRNDVSPDTVDILDPWRWYRFNASPDHLQKLLVVMYEVKLKRLIQQMKKACGNNVQREQILDEMVELLSQYST